MRSFARCKARLLEMCPKGTRVYALTYWPSSYGRSHMRYVRLFVVSNGELIELTLEAGVFIGSPRREHGVPVSGGNSAADHDTVYGLSQRLYGETYALKCGAL